MNTISVAAVLKRPFFRIRGEQDTLPFALIKENNKFGKLIAPVEYTLFDKAGNTKIHFNSQNLEGWLNALPVGAKVIIPHFENKVVCAFEVFKQEAVGYWRNGTVEITPEMLEI